MLIRAFRCNILKLIRKQRLTLNLNIFHTIRKPHGTKKFNVSVYTRLIWTFDFMLFTSKMFVRCIRCHLPITEGNDVVDSHAKIVRARKIFSSWKPTTFLSTCFWNELNNEVMQYETLSFYEHFFKWSFRKS